MAPTEEAGGKNTQRRDLLRSIEKKAQEKWTADKIFEENAPASGEGEKYFANFPYPYMNGLLHLGHAFSLSKAEFAVAYHRLRGKHALFPFGWHCTGMPIKAAAGKIEREMAQYGNPPVFPIDEEPQEEEKPAAAGETDPAVFKAKKGKIQNKAVKASTQWEIMRKSGFKDEDIAAFSDPVHWLRFFPPLGKRDVQAMGCGVDWRRSFITTDVNPYYDSFVRWQFNTLKKHGKVVRAKRYSVFSPLDGQPCADHDRATGEGVGPQEYTLIKLEVLEESLVGPLAPLAGRKVFLGAATLRPETMYGQTNCWVLPEGQYGAFEMVGDEVTIMTRRAALNMSYQELTPETGKPKCLLDITGQDLIGCALRAPNAIHPKVYALPMLTILTTKGTGIVTSVPSDAPDDYMALMDLKSKPALREKFGVKDEWVLPFEVVPIINIPDFGDAAAPKVCADLKIKSQNDREKLDEAKRLTYLKGFTDGVMLVGAHKGTPVKDAKPVIRGEMIAAKQALVYSEPEKPVQSRSGDDCVVALTDQWYLEYGEEEWRKLAVECLAKMETYHEETRRAFEHTLGWLKQWACSRAFGLGSRIPWDHTFLIESLSDSTIYMAYYTVAHLLQKGDMFGADTTSVDPALLTDEVWDAVLLGAPLPAGNPFPKDLLETMRREYNFWYPFDLRVSGKDLIQNHLTFSIYNHTAIFTPDRWPRAMRCNGHLLLNNAKMSKSTGNFKTLEQAILEFGADAMRFALADAGDTLDDANFLDETANAAILKLTKELAWVEETLAAGGDKGTALRAGDASSFTFADRVFSNELDVACVRTAAAYEAMQFREAVKCGFYDLQNARDVYRVMAASDGLNAGLVRRFIEVQTKLIAPICPHLAEHIWSEVLKKDGSVLKSGWPAAAAPDLVLRRAAQHLQDCITDWRKSMVKATAPAKGGKGGAAPAAPQKVVKLEVFVAERYGGWQEVVLGILESAYDAAANSFPPDGQLLDKVKASPLAGEADFKTVLKQVMPFLKYKMDEAKGAVGPAALKARLPFDEKELFQSNAEFIRKSLMLEEPVAVHLVGSAEAAAAPAAAKVDQATPGRPAVHFVMGAA